MEREPPVLVKVSEAERDTLLGVPHTHRWIVCGECGQASCPTCEPGEVCPICGNGAPAS